MTFVSLRSTELLSQYFGATEEKIRSVFKHAREAAPCVLFFDEFDAIACRRGHSEKGSSTSGDLYTRILSTFLNELDGVTSSSSSHSDLESEGRILVVAACHDLTSLDEALLRPGRLQYHIKLDLPNDDDIFHIVSRALGKMSSLAADVAVGDIVSRLVSSRARGYAPTAADVGTICKDALVSAINEAVEVAKATDVDSSVFIRCPREISKRHFEAALCSFEASLPFATPLTPFTFDANATFSMGVSRGKKA